MVVQASSSGDLIESFAEPHLSDPFWAKQARAFGSLTEAVQSAGLKMRDAAADMNRAASNFEYNIDRNHRFLDDWLMRFEAVMEKNK